MTDRTGGKTLNYKLLSTQGRREVVNREPRPSVRSKNNNSIQERADQGTSVHNPPVDIVAEFAALSLSGNTTQVESSVASVESSVILDGNIVSAALSASSFVGNPSQELVSVASPDSLSLSSSDNSYKELIDRKVLDIPVQGEGLTQGPDLNKELFATVASPEGKMETSKAVLDQIKIQEESMADDIDDFMDENPLDDISSSILDLDDAIKGIESLRSIYRNKHKEIVNGVGEDNYEQKLKDEFQSRIDYMKKYILTAKSYRKTLRMGEEKVKTEGVQLKKQKLKFLGEEVSRSMKDLEDKFCEDLTEESDEETTRRKNELSQNSKDIQVVAKAIQDIVIAGETETVISYDSASDIYTFQDDFERLHLRDTPSDSLPDLLKNNFLGNPAKLLVKDETNISEIWVKLKDAYGDQKVLLSKKLAEFNTVEVPSKNKDSVELLSRVINLMKDLVRLAKRHSIENNLYYGDGLNQIYRLLGNNSRRRWFEIMCDIKEEAEKWERLIVFLEKELKVTQQEAIVMRSSSALKPSKEQHKHDSPRPDQSHNKGGGSSHYSDLNTNTNNKVCFVCGESDHVQTNGPRGSKIVQYVACKNFAEMKAAERFKFLKTKGYCAQCLFPGADQNQGKHKEGKCQRDYVCKNPSHERFPSKKHVLCCEEHKNDQENKDTLQKFKEKYILRQTQLPDHSRNIQLSHFCCDNAVETNVSVNPDNMLSAEAASFVSHADKNENLSHESAIYMLQTIEVDHQQYNIFYDNGCKKFVSKFDAVQRLGSRAWVEKPGPFKLRGVGGMVLEAPHGEYSVKLPRADGTDAVMSGLCLDQVTLTFPQYPLKGQVEDDIRRAMHEHSGNLRNLPDLPAFVGGDTHLMIGIGFYRHFPDLIMRLPSGLSVYQSKFCNPDGSLGVVGGEHAVFTQIENQYDLAATAFLSEQLQLFRLGYQVNPDVSLLGYRETDHPCFESILCESCLHGESHHAFNAKQTIFSEAENTGSEISYRCIKCRSCKDCKNHEQSEALSIKEEVEQDKIDHSIIVDTENRETIASLPLIADPVIRLAPNRNIAERSYYRQLKVLQDPKDKAALIKAESVLQSLGFVEWVKNLPPEIQKSLKENPVQNFIAWSIAWKLDSVTTSCRPVFNASQKTKSGYCLNDIVAKGKNSLNVLLEIFIRWRTHHVAYHNDVQKMYNKVKLQQEHWCLQRYLFQEELDPNKRPEEKVIKTIIYGVKSSGNQAQRGLRLTAELSKDEYPEAYEMVLKDTYMDDTMSGAETHALVDKRADELEIMLSRGGFTLKGCTVSGRPPDPALSSDGESIFTAGHIFYSKTDKIAVNVKDLNFATKLKGRKSEIINEIPSQLTRRQCTSKVHEIFDMTGMMAPIVATMKISLHQLVVRKLKWDDTLPNELMPIWNSHFEMMKEMKNIRYQRAVIPPDAINLEAETLDFGDASKSNICAAIYVRFQKKDGSHSCQLIFAKTKLVPDGMTQPRAELYAAVLNAHTGEVVRRALSKIHRDSLKFTDSQIVLFWITNMEKTLELWNRNRVVEIQRFTDISMWRYVSTENMMADIGTRPCYSIEVIKPDSVWINGYAWMRDEQSEFPMMTAEEISIGNQNKLKHDIEDITTTIHVGTDEIDTQTQTEQIEMVVESSQPDNDREEKLSMQAQKILSRYKYSKYLVDPNRHRFESVVRIFAIVLTYIEKIRARLRMKSADKHDLVPVPVLIISEEQINNAKAYFYKKATEEVKHFVISSKYKDISMEKDSLLLYTGRILPTDGVTIVGNATKIMKDLSATTFTVPIVDRYSPVAISICNEIHWYHDTAQHTGSDTTWRYVLQNIFIIEGRPLVNMICNMCERCRYLNKRTLEITMGAISGHNLTIAPAFYITQVDLAGPFSAYSPHNKRSTIKIWLSVWCCATTSTTSIKVMDDYSTSAFLDAFIRFACDAGYPKTLLIDAGSQIVKGCESMEIKYWDLSFKLHKSKSIECEICPVGGHNFNGKVERKIREIKKSITKTVSKQRLSLMQWETLGSTIANSINNMPLALGRLSKSSLECMDFITPNRLKMGRNNERSPVGEVVFADKERIIQENKAIFDAWFEVWLLAHVPKLMDQSKWYRSGKDLKPGDVVLFLKQDSTICSNYQFGMVESIESGRDKKVRKVSVRYRNHTEDVDRTTKRAARSLVVIRRAQEMNIMDDLGDISRYVENRWRLHQSEESTLGECNKL